MTATPLARHAVHFEDISASDFGTPLSAAAPTSIDYLNAQLVAHGFAHGAGLNLADLRGKDQQVVLKCLANMLGQRLEDMGRSEQLSAKYKTLSYDHERLIEQHRAARDAAAQAEREMETGKAKVDSAQKRLSAEEDKHKKSRDDLQRLKMAMQYLRTTTANEVKRKEKEVEKMADRWAKISNEQVRLGSVGAGLACANLLPQPVVSEENSLLEALLADSDAARLRLLKENDSFRDVILACANALQTLHHSTVSATTKVEIEEPELILSDTLFASSAGISQAETAQEKLRGLFSSLREALSKAGSNASSRRQSLRQREEDAQQIRELQTANAALQLQLQEALEENQAQGQKLLDQFVTDARFMAGKRVTADASMDLMATPARDMLVDTLEEQRKGLESEREKFTEAAIDLGREKAALEAERLRFLEEQRLFMVQSILDDLPPTPEAAGKPVPTEVPPKIAADLAISAKPSKPSKKPLRSNLKQSLVQKAVEATAAPSQPSAAIPAPSTSKLPPPTALPPLKLEKHMLGASTTPPLPDDDLSPTSPTDQRASAIVTPVAQLESARPEQTRAQSDPTFDKPKAESNRMAKTATAPLPHHLRTQTTPVRPTYGVVRAQHKYSPAVPSPLRVVRVVESPPSSPESKAQAQRAQRPPVIAEEDEEEEESEDSAADAVQEQQQEELPIDTAEDDIPFDVEPRPGSLSPLSRILQMGLSPAIAPTLAVSSFPGLLGTGPKLGGKPQPLTKGLGLGLGNKGAAGFGGFGSMPGGFQLGTAITRRAQPTTTGAGVTRQVAKTVKTAVTVKTIKPSAAVAKQKQPKPPKVAFGENRRTSKESTSSSGSSESAGPSGSGSGRSSAASNKPSSGAVKPRNVIAGGGVAGKENEAKRKAALAQAKASVVKKAAASQAPKAIPAVGVMRKPGVAPSGGSKSTTGKGWKG